MAKRRFEVARAGGKEFFHHPNDGFIARLELYREDHIFSVFCKIFSIDWHKTIDDRMIGLVDAFPSSYKISLEMPGPTQQAIIFW